MRQGLTNEELDYALRGLGGLELDPAARPLLGAVLDRAAGRTKSIRRNNMLRNIASTVLLLLAGLLATIAFTLLPRSDGLAVAEGWVVEFKVDVPVYGGLDYGINSPKDEELPQRRLEKLVADWSEEHKSAAIVPGQALAVLHVDAATEPADELLLARANASLVFASGDEELLETLLATLRSPGQGLPVMIEPVQRYSKKWYLREKTPELYAQQTIYIDGKAWDYPADFGLESSQASEDELRNLSTMVIAAVQAEGGRGQYIPGDEPRVLRTFYNMLSNKTMEKTGAGMVLVLSTNDKREVRLDTIAQEDPFPHIWKKESMCTVLYSGPGPEETAAQVIARLGEILDKQAIPAEGTVIELEVYRLSYPLYPVERFEPGQAAGSYSPTEAERAEATRWRDEYHRAAEAWLDEHPELRTQNFELFVGGRPTSASSDPQRFLRIQDLTGSTGRDDPRSSLGPSDHKTNKPQPYVAIDFFMRGLSPEERAELRATLDAVGGPGLCKERRLYNQFVPVQSAHKESPADSH